MQNCDIRDFGAVGDGETLNTAAIQAAIDACGASGGGRVTIAGGRYLCGRIDLRSGVELHMEVDGVLLASTRGEDFPDIETDFWRTELAPRRNRRAFIYAEGCHDIAITGRGTIDCQGSRYMIPNPDQNSIWRYTRKGSDLPARMVFLIGCRDVLLEDVLLYEPCGGWSYWICDCDRVTVERIRIESNLDYPNADGLHINCSRDVRVSNSTIYAGDDALIVRAYTGVLHKKTACERVSVTNCSLVSHCSAIRIAWINDYIIRDCVFSNLTIADSNSGIAIVLPEGGPAFGYTDDGGDATQIERLSFQNIVMDRCHFEPVAVKIMKGNHVKAVRDLQFSQIQSVSGVMPSLYGREDCRLERIRFSDCSFRQERLDPQGAPRRTSNYFVNSQEAPYFAHVEELRLDGVSFSSL